MNTDSGYRLINKNFLCINCGRRQKKLVYPQESTTKCQNCDGIAQEIGMNEFNREDIDRTYRLIFNSNNERDTRINQYHNRTDIFDRNPNNVHGDPRERVVHLSREEIERKNRDLQRYRQQIQTQFSQNARSNNNIQSSNQSQQGSASSRSLINYTPFDYLFDFPFSRMISPFNGSVNHHQHNHRFLDFFGDFFNMPSDDFFNDNYASNFSSNFPNPMVRIIFIRTANNEEQNQNRGASEESLKNLKKFKMNYEHTKKGDKGEIEYPSCSICLLEINKGEDSILIPCGHIYHEECILKWFKVNNKCPVCRYDLSQSVNRGGSFNQNENSNRNQGIPNNDSGEIVNSVQNQNSSNPANSTNNLRKPSNNSNNDYFVDQQNQNINENLNDINKENSNILIDNLQYNSSVRNNVNNLNNEINTCPFNVRDLEMTTEENKNINNQFSSSDKDIININDISQERKKTEESENNIQIEDGNF